MSLSRTARILIALLLVAAAAFVWVNYFSETPAPPGPTVEGPAVPDADATAPDPEDGAPDEAAPDDGVAAADPANDAVPIDAEPDDGPGVIADLPSVAPSPDDDPPTVVTPAPGDDANGDAPAVVVGPEGTTVGRAVTAAELPFLVTAPPAADEVAEADPDDPDAAARPGPGTRATVNPFSPIVVQAPEAPAAEAPAATPEPDVVAVDVPAAPRVEEVEAAPPTPRAPTPAPVAPADEVARDLPRALPSGVLSSAPALLTTPRATQAPRGVAMVPDVASAREPEDSSEPPRLDPIGEAATSDSSRDPAPLAPGQVPAAGVPDQPLVAGTDGLSRYLRNRNVSFTGSVLGSVGVGVFRAAELERPLVLALGQSLPETEIVLTDLQGQSAEFTLGDTTHILTLDLRR
ncbi:MAG: hypothetical protein WD336_07180 [Trueperaceae bacterium]